MKFKSVAIIIGVILVLGSGGYLVFQKLAKGLPGERIEDLGREHVSYIGDVTYNSNPPTSGPHFPVWAKRGVYDRIISDGHLIHSLEHGYIVISYNCDKLPSAFSIVSEVLAHDEGEEHPHEATESTQPTPSIVKPLTQMKASVSGQMGGFTPSSAPAVEVSLPDSFQSESCKNLVGELDDVLGDFDRVVIVPRLDMDNFITLTAWNRILKFDKLEMSAKREFIKSFHNMGPEKTNE